MCERGGPIEFRDLVIIKEYIANREQVTVSCQANLVIVQLS